MSDKYRRMYAAMCNIYAKAVTEKKQLEKKQEELENKIKLLNQQLELVNSGYHSDPELIPKRIKEYNNPANYNIDFIKTVKEITAGGKKYYLDLQNDRVFDHNTRQYIANYDRVTRQIRFLTVKENVDSD